MSTDKQKSIKCPECQNRFSVDHEVTHNDIVECPFCGIELEIIGFGKEGEILVSIVEEEK